MALLEVKDLTMRFGGVTAVNQLSFAVESDSITSLIGPNGAGKTSAFNCLTGFYRPSAGDILFKGRSLMGIAPHLITKRGIARTFQNVRLFKKMTVLENVMSGMHCRVASGVLGAILRPPGQRRDGVHRRGEVRDDAYVQRLPGHGDYRYGDRRVERVRRHGGPGNRPRRRL